MSPLESYAPLTQSIDVPHQPSNRLLLNTLRDFAFNNTAFRGGLLDEIILESTTGDAMEPDIFPEDHLQIKYKFEAVRHRYLEEQLLHNISSNGETNKPRERYELAFYLSVVAIRDAIDLPPHIAMQAYEIDDPELAIQQGGRASLEHEIRFRITTDHRVLETIESYLFKDGQENIVAFAAVDSSDSYTFTLESDGNEDEEYDMDTTPEEGDEEGMAEQAMAAELESTHMQLETLDDQTSEEAEAMWQQLRAMEQAMGGGIELAQHADEQLRQAFSAFTIFKNGLRQQLGL